MDKKKFSSASIKITSDEGLRKFLEKNKNKIPKGVRVERAFSIDETIPEDGIVIHAGAFNLGLYLPFHPLIREILSRHRLAPTQLAPNCWRIMYGIIALNCIHKINLGWSEFCHCYAVKKHPAGTYYFSHRENKIILVTDLPRDEKRLKDDLISLTGDWERRPGDADTGHNVPKAPVHKPTDLELQDSDDHSDIDQKALDALKKENRNWRYLIHHQAYLELQMRESKIADESEYPTLPTATCPANSTLGGYVRSVEADGLFEKTTTSNKKQKLIRSDSDYELTNPSKAAAKSKGTINNINQQGWKDQDHETSDKSKKNINDIDQLLKRKFFDKARSQAAQSTLQVFDVFVNYIEELQAANERKDKDLEELKLLVKKEEPVTAIARTPGATDTESLKKGTGEENQNLKKQIIEELQKYVDGQLAHGITHIKEAQVQQPHPRTYMWIGSPLSKNEQPLAIQNQNHDHIQGAAPADTTPNMTLKLCTTTTNDQNDIPGNHHHHQQQQQQQTSSNGSNIMQQYRSMDAPIYSNNLDYPIDHQNYNNILDLEPCTEVHTWNFSGQLM